MNMQPDQLGFDALLETAAQDNQLRIFEKETTHLPTEWKEAIAYHCNQIARHDAAMLANDFKAAMAIRDDAYLLAKKLNGGKPGILAGHDAPGCVLARETAAKDGDVPKWGQAGLFTVQAAGTVLCVDMEGIFGIGATAMPYLGYSVRAADLSKLFLSETGYRSFLGVSVTPEVGMTVAGFVRRVAELHIAQELKGKLVHISPQFQKQQAGL